MNPVIALLELIRRFLPPSSVQITVHESNKNNEAGTMLATALLYRIELCLCVGHCPRLPERWPEKADHKLLTFVGQSQKIGSCASMRG